MKTTMDQQEGMATNKPPLFIGEYYAYWSVKMRCHLMSLGWKVWAATEKEHNIGNQYPTDTVELGEYEGNSKSLNVILSCLTTSLQCMSSLITFFNLFSMVILHCTNRYNDVMFL